MKTTNSRSEIGAEPRRILANVLQNLRYTMLRLSHELETEFRRLNSARVGADELSRLAPSDRVRAVKDALMTHHRGNSRCC